MLCLGSRGCVVFREQKGVCLGSRGVCLGSGGRV